MQESQVIENQSRSAVSEASQVKRSLRQNPFTTYRDPETGVWVVVKTMSQHF